jgi:hypothetical protein
MENVTLRVRTLTMKVSGCIAAASKGQEDFDESDHASGRGL